MKRILFSVFFLLLTLHLQAQQVSFQERAYRVNATGKMVGASTLTQQGNIMLSGPLSGNLQWDKNIFLLLNQNLDTLWTRVGPKMEIVSQDIEQAPGNGFIWGGTVRSANPATPSAYKDDMLLQRLDVNGIPKWTKTINTFADRLHAIETAPNGDYILGGYGGMPTKQTWFSVLKTDSLGNILWRRSYDWSSTCQLTTLKLAANGNLMAVGTTRYPVPTGHLKLMLLNSNGDSIRGLQLIVTGFNRIEGMRVTDNDLLPLSDGGFLISCAIDTTINNTEAYMSMLVKVDSNLQLVWKYVHRDPSVWRQFSKMKELTDGSIVALGYDYAYTNHPPSNKFYLHHFNPFGLPINTYTFTTTLGTRLYPYTLEALPDSSYIIGGSVYNAANQQWGFYAAKAKIAGLAGIVSSTKPEQALQPTALGQSYPNPAQNQAIIPYHLPNNTKSAKILLLDITGREVGSYSLKANQKQGSLPVNLSSFRNGLYLYTLVLDGKPVATKKLAVAQ